MPKKTQNPPIRNWGKLVCWAGVVILPIYLWYFMQLPSIQGYQAEGTALNRWFDLQGLLVPELMMQGLFAGGQMPIGWVGRIPVLLFAGGWLVYCYFFGESVLRTWQGSRQLLRIERLALAVLAGLAITSTLTLLVGLVSMLRLRVVFVGVHVIAFVLTRWLMPQRHLVAQASDGEAFQPGEIAALNIFGVWTSRLLPVAVAVLAVLSTLTAFTAPFEFDVVAYHLQAPKEFFLEGQIFHLENNVYANMPLAVEMQTLAAMVLVGSEEGFWFGGMVGKVLTCAYGLFGLMLVGGWVARRYSRWAGWAAAGIVLSSPGVLMQQGLGLVDMAVASFGVAWAVLVTELCSAYVVRGKEVDSDLFWGIFLAALMAGGAGASKYPGLVFFCLPMVAFMAWLAWEKRGQASLVSLAFAMAIGFALTTGPWLAKNLVFITNPVYPLAESVFGNQDLNEDQIRRWKAAHRVPGSQDGLLTSYGPKAVGEGVRTLFFSSPMLPATLLVLAAVGTLAWLTQQKRAVVLLLLMQIAWMLVVWWGATHRIDRFWLPVIPLWGMLAGVGVFEIGKHLSKGVASIAVLIPVCLGVLHLCSGSLVDNRIFVTLSSLREDAGNEQRAGRLPATTKWINDELNQPDVNLLLVGEGRVFDFEPAYSYSTCFNTSRGEYLADASPEQQKDWLQIEQFTHVFINWSEIERYRSPGNYGFSQWPTRADIETMIANGVLKPVENWPFDPQNGQLLEVQE